MNTDEKRIYLEAFGDEDGFADRLFDAFGDIIETKKSDGKTVSILFPLPCTLKTESEQIPAKYIFAAATDSRCRGRGYMSELIERVCKDDDCFYFLRPANRGLIGYYNRLGFKEIKGIGSCDNLPRIDVCDRHKKLAGGVCEKGEFTLMYRYSKPIDITELHFGYSMLV